MYNKDATPKKSEVTTLDLSILDSKLITQAQKQLELSMMIGENK
jgi:hypothetical protein